MEDGHRITNEILQEAVANELGLASFQEVTIKSFEVEGGCKKGDNYLCAIKAVEVVAEVKGKEKTLQYMAKCLPINEFRAKMLTEGNIFGAEIAMYTKIIPALRRMEPRISTPLTFYVSPETGMVVMENLKKKDYFMADKAKGLDVTQVKLTLDQLAFLHATSYHFVETYPNGGVAKFKEDFPELNAENWFLPETGIVMQQFTNYMAKLEETFLAIIEEHCSDKTQMVQKLRDYAEGKLARMRALQQPQGKFNCILHNDAWSNNFLFGKNASGEVDKIKVLDLQLSRRARPTVDLVYFFGGSTGTAFRRAHLEDMLQYYHARLEQSLHSLGHDISSVYPLEQLRKDFKDCYPLGFSMSTLHTMNNNTSSDNSEAFMDIEKLQGDESLILLMQKFREGQLKQARENAAIRNLLVDLAMEAEEMGVI